MNIAMITGRLTRDAELKSTNNGVYYSKFSIASSKKIKDKEKVLFMDCAIWGKYAETMNQYLEKGKQLSVKGELVFNSWENSEGRKCSRISLDVTDILLVGGRGSSNKPGDGNSINEPESMSDGEITF